MRIQDQAAYILHHRDYRDSSQILELFSRDYGRVTVVSKGSRSAKSKNKAILQPFIPLLVSWSGKGDMYTLTASESVSRAPLKLYSNALPSAFYINELIMKLLHKYDVHEDIFNLYKNTLEELQNLKTLEKNLRLFEKKLLELIGFGLNLAVDAETGEAIQDDQYYRYYVEHGPVLVNKHEVDRQHLLIKGSSLIAFDNDVLDSAEVLKDVKSIMRYMLSYYMDGKPIKSRELFR